MSLRERLTSRLPSISRERGDFDSVCFPVLPGSVMVRLARAEVFDPNEVAIAHVINRTVRRCFLMGDDEFSGKNFDHRKVWIEELLQRFAAQFGIDLICYSILSNHYHLILASKDQRQRVRLPCCNALVLIEVDGTA